jgi:glycosyltransferase involved in cell wall biosynthesis
MKVIGMMPAYNEEDIIEETIQHNLSQGLELIVLDNGSTDNTFNICKRFVDRIKLIQMKTSKFNINSLRRALYDMAIMSSPDWVIFIDADEFLQSKDKGRTLRDEIEEADSKGYNLIQFDRFDFFMTDDDNTLPSARQRLRYYSYHGDFLYRAWKFSPGITVEEGHYPVFPEYIYYNISPKKLLLLHYPYRTVEQAQKRLMSRLERTAGTDEIAVVGSAHYRRAAEFPSLVFNHHKLNKYEDDGNWNYEMKFIPIANPNPPKKEDLFSEEGTLKQFRSRAELQTTIKKQRRKIYELRSQLKEKTE